MERAARDDRAGRLVFAEPARVGPVDRVPVVDVADKDAYLQNTSAVAAGRLQQVLEGGERADRLRLGAFGEALLLDQQASGTRARNTLGWSPTRPSLLAEIEDGRYTD